MRVLIFLLLFLFIINCNFYACAEEIKSIAIVPFVSVTQKSSNDYKIEDEIANELLNIPNFNKFYSLLERVNLDKVIKEQALGISSLSDPEKASSFGKIVNAQYIITGILKEENNSKLTIVMSLVNVKTSEKVISKKITNLDKMNFNKGIRSLTYSFVSELGLKVDNSFIDSSLKVENENNFNQILYIVGGIIITGAIVTSIIIFNSPTQITVNW